MKKRILCIILSAMMLASLVSCSSGLMGVFTGDQTDDTPPQYIPPVENDGGEDGKENDTKPITSTNIENPFVSAEKHPISTVALNANKASYYYFRSLVDRNYTFQQLQKCSYAFKAEEFLNYFGFCADVPMGDEIFGIGASLLATPWNEGSALLRVTFKTEKAEADVPCNFVFHIDVTESMARENVLPLFIKAFESFVYQIDANDVISIVVCSDNEKIVLDGCRGDRKSEILDAANSVTVSSGSNSGADLGVAYEVARKNYIEGGDNRIILVSDGDVSEKLCPIVEENAKSGVFASVLGFGDSNHRNGKLERLALAGCGRYYYIDCEEQGEKVLGKEIFKPVIDVADDTVIKVDFDSRYVSEYRLIGYVYQGDTAESEGAVAPAGKIYAGDCITVCYEIKFAGEMTQDADFATLQMNYTASGVAKSQSVALSTELYSAQLNDDMRFMTAVLESLMVLQGSEHIGKLTLSDIYDILEPMNFEGHPERQEFRELISKIVFGTKK